MMRNEGNEYYRRGDFDNAIRLYTNACESGDHIALTNRAEIHLLRREYKQCLLDCNAFFTANPLTSLLHESSTIPTSMLFKTLLRCASAAYAWAEDRWRVLVESNKQFTERLRKSSESESVLTLYRTCATYTGHYIDSSFWIKERRTKHFWRCSSRTHFSNSKM